MNKALFVLLVAVVVSAAVLIYLKVLPARVGGTIISSAVTGFVIGQISKSKGREPNQ